MSPAAEFQAPCRLDACGPFSLLHALVFNLICLRNWHFFFFFFSLPKCRTRHKLDFFPRRKKKLLNVSFCFGFLLLHSTQHRCLPWHGLRQRLLLIETVLPKVRCNCVFYLSRLHVHYSALNFDKWCLHQRIVFEFSTLLWTLFRPVKLVPNYSYIYFFLSQFCWFKVFCLSLHSSNLTRTLIDNIPFYPLFHPTFYHFPSFLRGSDYLWCTSVTTSWSVACFHCPYPSWFHRKPVQEPGYQDYQVSSKIQTHVVLYRFGWSSVFPHLRFSWVSWQRWSWWIERRERRAR